MAVNLPFDLVAMVVITAALNASVFAPVIRETPLRIPIGFVFVCFVPGYVLIAAFYPERYRSDGAQERSNEGGLASTWPVGSRITSLERFLLAVGFSIVLTPMIGYAFNFTRWGVRLEPVLLALSAFTILIALVAAVRRWRLPREDQYSVTPRRLSPPLSVSGLRSGGKANYAANALLVVSIAFFAVAVGYTALAAPSSDGYSEMYLLTNESGNLIDANSTDRVTAGERNEIAVGVSNHEGTAVNYTVLVVQEEVPNAENRSVVNQTRLDAFELSVPANESPVREHAFSPVETERPSRVAWLLYTGDVPADPSTSNADYHVQLWVSSE